MIAIGKSVRRKEAPNKVTGRAKYTADLFVQGMMRAVLVTSPYAHARIKSMSISRAMGVLGVEAVITGEATAVLCGEVLEDRPPLARGVVRYYGEPVAIVVAHSEEQAMQAAREVQVEYEPLPVVNTIAAALEPQAPLLHETLASYRIAQQPVSPVVGTNIADHAKVRKGDGEEGFRVAEVVVEAEFELPQVEHVAMETRAAQVEILHDGRVIVHSTTQAPFEIQKLLASYFNLDQGKVIVNAPLLGGAFGGKAAVQLEVLAYLASRAVGGRLVRLNNTREHDMAMSPVGMGLLGHVRLGATRTGLLTAAAFTYYLDTGAYTDSSPRVARAICSECTGPYKVDHVLCDVRTVYTNHTYTTAFRGFGHMPLTFCIERAMDKLARKLGMDPVDLRRKNLLIPGDTTPTQVRLTESSLGNLPACMDRLAEVMDWDQGTRHVMPDGSIRAKGMACFWKTSSSPPDAVSGAILTFNQDGSVNLSTGTVEFGPGTKTTAAQILAEQLGLSIDQIHVHEHINTKVDPEHWKTVASLSTFMVGRAVMEAAQDAIAQLKGIAAIVLKCAPGDLDVGGGKIYIRDDPALAVTFKDVAHGFAYPEGDGIGAQIIARGSYIVRHITPLDPETGKGRPGPGFTVGAQGVEVEFDPVRYTYRLVSAVSVLDAGRVINPQGARGNVMGGMNMGLGYGSREGIQYDREGRMLNDQLRLYKVMRVGEQPEYAVHFVETPQLDAPYGARAVGEHGILGMPAALANALSEALGEELDRLPITPESLWRAKQGRHRQLGSGRSER